MAAQILVALKSEDRLSQMIPYIEEIAQPGMKVVFLIGFHPQAASKAPRYDSLTFNSVEDVGFAGGLEKAGSPNENVDGPREQLSLSAEHKVFLALEGLHKRGIEIAVDVYAGSLKRVVKNYMLKGNVRFIMKRAGKDSAIMQFVRRAFPIFGSFNQRNFSPVLLLHSTHAVKA
jgi:hypothetical protein